MMKIHKQQQKTEIGLVVIKQTMPGMIADSKLTLFQKDIVQCFLLSATCDVVVSVFVIVASQMSLLMQHLNHVDLNFPCNAQFVRSIANNEKVCDETAKANGHGF